MNLGVERDTNIQSIIASMVVTLPEISMGGTRCGGAVTDRKPKRIVWKIHLHNNHILFTQILSFPGGGLEASRDWGVPKLSSVTPPRSHRCSLDLKEGKEPS